MTGSILVTLDGSSFSETALPYARALAMARGSRLRLLTVLEAPAGHLRVQHRAVGEHLAAARSHQVYEYHRGLAATLRGAGLTVDCSIVEGSPAAKILEQSAEHKIVCICMATHGRGGLGRWILGSVADRIMRSAPNPILLVPPHESVGMDDVARIRRILVPLDGSDLARCSLDPAVGLAHAFGADVVLAHVVPSLRSMVDWGSPYVPELDEVEAEIADDARADLQSVQGSLPTDLTISAALLHGDPASALVTYVEKEPIDLTAMTTHGRGGLPRLAIGSVAERLVRAGVPVMLIPAPHEDAKLDVFAPPAASEVLRGD